MTISPFLFSKNVSDDNSSDSSSDSSSKKRDKYSLVDHIISASNYYEALEIPEDSSFDEIRRAYIKKSRICHPDKFVPPYANATKSFQILSEAYKTLSEPNLKSSYNNGLGQYRCSEENAVDIFQQVIRQLYIEIMEGEFQTLRTVIQIINEMNGVVHISEEVMSIAEIGFLQIRDIITSSRKYYNIVQFELLRLYDLQDEIRNLSYFDVWRRFKLSLAIAKSIIQIPLLVNKAAKQEYTSKEGGLLGLHLEGCLEKAICLFETD